MDSSDLLLHQVALQLCILLGVSISAPLIVLAAVMDPHVRRDESGAHLVATKDMRDCLARLRASVAVLNVHAYNRVCLSIFGGVWWGIRCRVGRVGGRGASWGLRGRGSWFGSWPHVGRLSGRKVVHGRRYIWCRYTAFV